MLKKKSKKLPIIIIAAFAIVAIAVNLILAITFGSGSKNSEKLLAKAEQYLTSLDYEQAIATYKKIIEIDNGCVEAYLGIADAYLGRAGSLETAGKQDDAIAILNEGINVLDSGYSITGDEAVNEKADELKSLLDSIQNGNSDSSGQGNNTSDEFYSGSSDSGENVDIQREITVTKDEFNRLCGTLDGQAFFELSHEDLDSIISNYASKINPIGEASEDNPFYFTEFITYKDYESISFAQEYGYIGQNNDTITIPSPGCYLTAQYYAENSSEGNPEKKYNISNDMNFSTQIVPISGCLIGSDLDSVLSLFGSNLNLMNQEESGANIIFSNDYDVKTWFYSFNSQRNTGWTQLRMQSQTSSNGNNVLALEIHYNSENGSKTYDYHYVFSFEAEGLSDNYTLRNYSLTVVND